MLGYNVRLYQLAVFVIGSVLAGMSGVLYTLWGSYITPSSMGLTAAALPIIWVAAGGRKDITATLLATVLSDMAVAAAGGQRQSVRADLDGRHPAGRRAVRAGRAVRHRVEKAARPEAIATGRDRAQDHLARHRPERDMATILQTRGLKKYFGGLYAINGVDLAIEEGELRCLIGPNGAGKSTLFKLILGSYQPSEGAILFKGEDITTLRPHLRVQRGLSIKFQVPGIFLRAAGRAESAHRAAEGAPRRRARSGARAAARAHRPRSSAQRARRKSVAWTAAMAGDRDGGRAAARHAAARRADRRACRPKRRSRPASWSRS